MNLLSIGNPKTLKGSSRGFNTYILHLAPANLSGYETCPKRTIGCTASCLNMAGRGGLMKKGETTNTIQEARKRKTKLFFEDRPMFMTLLVADVELGIKQSIKQGLTPVFRLNGTSDISWEKYAVARKGVVYKNVFTAFPEVQFYDYTKVLNRKIHEISNYQLTFSSADGNQTDVAKAIEQGYNVAVVFGFDLPGQYMGREVFGGDESDLRFLDPVGVIVGLTAKGKAKKDTSGFVVQQNMIAVRMVA